MPVEGVVPDYLARCVKKQAVKTQVTERIENEERAGRPFGQTSTENHEVALPEISSDKWHPASKALPSPLNDFYLADFRSNRVFATPGSRENGDTSEESDTFYEYLQRVQRPDHSLAEEVVYCLALARSVEFPQERILLLYEADPFETFRYPVPPDAEFWPLFRPIERGEDHDFGRTCPGGPPCYEERDEPELVHGNPPISSDRVWMRAL